MSCVERIYIVDPRVLPCVEDYLRSRGAGVRGSRVITWGKVCPEGVSEMVFVQQPPPDHEGLVVKADRVCLLNIEQLSRVTARRWIVSSLMRCPSISCLIDYSATNMDLISDTLRLEVSRDLQTRVEPFLFVRPPFPLVRPSNQKAVAFIGAMSKRRQSVLDALRREGLEVRRVTGWKEERDRQIAACSVLVNIHYADDYTVFESFRCTPWVMHPTLKVVSETSVGQEREWTYPHIFWEDYADIVKRVVSLTSTM